MQLIHTGKIVKSSTRDGKLGSPRLAVAGNPKIDSSMDSFNGILNELECEIVSPPNQVDLGSYEVAHLPGSKASHKGGFAA